jgi:hypothetical protein
MADAIEAIEDGIVWTRVQVVWENQVASTLYYYRYRGCIHDFIIIEPVRKSYRFVMRMGGVRGKQSVD